MTNRSLFVLLGNEWVVRMIILIMCLETWSEEQVSTGKCYSSSFQLLPKTCSHEDILLL